MKPITSSSPFRSFGNAHIIKPPTADEMAADLATETCQRIKELRAEALAREQACEPPLPATDESRGLQATLDALMKGRHRWIAVPIILEHFPELVTPAEATEEQIAAATGGGA